MVPVRALQRFARLGIALTVMALWLPLWSHALHHRLVVAAVPGATGDLCIGLGDAGSSAAARSDGLRQAPVDTLADGPAPLPPSSHDALNLLAQACELSCAGLAAATLPAAGPGPIAAPLVVAVPRIPASVPARAVAVPVRPHGQGPPQA